MWTLNDALQECARNTYNAKTMVTYSGKGLEYANRFLSGINYAIRKIAREKIGVVTQVSVTLDDKSQFPMPAKCIRIIGVFWDGVKQPFSTDVNEVTTVDGFPNQTVSVTYEMIPDELTMANLSTPLPIDERYIDPRVLCQYANYQFLSEEGTDYDSSRAQVWLGLFNDSFDKIVATNRMPTMVRYNG